MFAALSFMLPYGVLSAIGIYKGPKADSFAVTGLHGEKMSLSERGGKPVFLYDEGPEVPVYNGVGHLAGQFRPRRCL